MADVTEKKNPLFFFFVSVLSFLTPNIIEAIRRHNKDRYVCRHVEAYASASQAATQPTD